MKLISAVGFMVFTGTLLLGQYQRTPTPGLSKHANVTRKNGGSGPAAVSTSTKANSDALAKIEQQRMIQAQANNRPAASGPATPAPQNKNKPIKFAYHPPSNPNH